MKNYLKPFILFHFMFFVMIGCLNDTQEYNNERDLEYLEEFRMEEGVEETSSGVLYKVLEEGDGDRPGANNHVIVTYEGESFDGTIRYSTEDAQHQLGFDMFIPEQMAQFTGLAEGILLMKEGSKYKFVLAPELATGDGRVYTFDLSVESFLRHDQEQFFENNKNDDDVLETTSGLQYRVLEEGDGTSPLLQDVVDVHYTGTYTNGYVFDASPSGETVSFEVNNVIPGFSEGLQLMSEGSRYRFYIPPALGYGNNAPQFGAILIFDVELVSVVR